jgi:ELWxxDGT repeat protein
LNPGAPAANPFSLTPGAGRVFFFADDGVHGVEPWTSDGTPGGTFLAGEVRPGACGAFGEPMNVAAPAALVHPDGTFYFAADDGLHGLELWALRADEASRFRRGEASGDGVVNLTDAIAVLGYLFAGGPPPACDDAADADDDGRLDITDPIALLLHLFSGGAPPPPPQADCGPDPSADGLGCLRGC